MPPVRMHSAVAVTLLLRALDASVTFNLGDNATATWYSPTMSSFLGPQPEDHLPATTGPFVLFSGDLCDSGAFPSTTISGKVVVGSIEASSTLHCTYETTYLNLYNSGAVAFIGISPDVIPGKGAFGHDGTRGARTRSPPMLYVWTGPSQAEYQMVEAAAGLGYNATVFPDRNVWVGTYTSWYYQLFVRAIPGTVLLGAGAVAAVFLAVHLMNIAKRYNSSTGSAPREGNAQRHRITYIVKRIGIPQVTLMVEAITATAAGLGLAIGGLYSTSNLSEGASGFFITLLSGWGFACSIGSGIAWNRDLHAVVDTGAKPSLATRILRGDYRTATAALCIVPILLDTAVSASIAMQYSPLLLDLVYIAVLFALQLMVSGHIIAGVVRFYKVARQVRRNVVRNGNDAVDGVLKRLSFCALGMALSMIMYCAGAAVLAIPSVGFSPGGWTVSFAMSNTARALDSAFRVAIFKPRSNRAIGASPVPGRPSP
ncbi:Uncharacterized protein PBTT_03960 [Plasmodiophora brassicae]